MSSSSSFSLPSGSSLGQFLWESCTLGDVTTVTSLLALPDIDINWGDVALNRTPLYRACGHGKIEVVMVMLRDPRIQVNQQQNQGGSPLGVAAQQGYTEVVQELLRHPEILPDIPQRDGCTPLYVACSHNQSEIVRVLLQDPRVDVNSPATKGATPFFVACQEGALEVIRLLLADSRVNVNAAMAQGETPLWIAAQRGHMEVVKMLLASDRGVQLGHVWAQNGLTEEEQARHSGHVELADILRECSLDPVKAIWKLRLELGILHTQSAELFVLVVLNADQYLKLKQPLPDSKVTRFFRMMAAFPMEIQMTTCNLLYGLNKSHILTQHSEPAVRKFLLGK